MNKPFVVVGKTVWKLVRSPYPRRAFGSAMVWLVGWASWTTAGCGERQAGATPAAPASAAAAPTARIAGGAVATSATPPLPGPSTVPPTTAAPSPGLAVLRFGQTSRGGTIWQIGIPQPAMPEFATLFGVSATSKTLAGYDHLRNHGIWDGPTGQLLGWTNTAQMGISADGRTVISIVKNRDYPYGATLRELRHDFSVVRSQHVEHVESDISCLPWDCKFSQDKTLLCSTGLDLRRWPSLAKVAEVDHFKPPFLITSPTGDSGTIIIEDDVRISNDNQRVYFVSNKHGVYVWHAQGNGQVEQLYAPEGVMEEAFFTLGVEKIAFADGGQIKILDLPTRQIMIWGPRPKLSAIALGLSATGKYLAISETYREIVVYETATRKEVWRKSDSVISSVRFSEVDEVFAYEKAQSFQYIDLRAPATWQHIGHRTYFLDFFEAHTGLLDKDDVWYRFDPATGQSVALTAAERAAIPLVLPPGAPRWVRGIWDIAGTSAKMGTPKAVDDCRKPLQVWFDPGADAVGAARRPVVRNFRASCGAGNAGWTAMHGVAVADGQRALEAFDARTGRRVGRWARPQLGRPAIQTQLRLPDIARAGDRLAFVRTTPRLAPAEPGARGAPACIPPDLTQPLDPEHPTCQVFDTIEVYALAQPTQPLLQWVAPGPVTALSFDASGSLVYVGLNDGRVLIVPIRGPGSSGSPGSLGTSPADSVAAPAVAGSAAAGPAVAGAAAAGAAAAGPAAAGPAVVTEHFHRSAIRGFELSDDGQWLHTVDEQSFQLVWPAPRP